jgi:putative ABC transport system permease protein
MVRVISYRLARGLRSRWAGIVVLVVLVAAVTGVVITFAAGAQRTVSAPARYAHALGGGFDATVTQEHGGRPRTEEVRSLPAVTSVDAYTFVFGGLLPGPDEPPADALVFAGSPAGSGRVVDGRAASPDVEGEFVANPELMKALGLHLGDHLQLVTLTQEQADAGDFQPGGAVKPAGPSLMGTLVGVVDGPQGIDDQSPVAIFSPKLLERPEIGVSLTFINVHLADGTSLDDLRADLDTLPGSNDLSVKPFTLIGNDLRRAVTTQGRALWILAIVAGIAAVTALGQLVSRQTRLSPPERERLGTIGFTDRQALVESTARSAVPIVVGCLLGAVLAIALSRLFPTGFVRQMEPAPGVLVQWGTFLAVVGALLVGLLVWATTATAISIAEARSVRPSPTVDAVATRTASASSGVGVRFAFTRARGERGSVWGALTGVALAVCGLTAALTFGASLARLIDQPFRYGGNYDVALGDNGGQEMDPQLVERLRDDDNVTSLMFYADGVARSGRTTVPLSGLEAARGPGTPLVLSGRLPAAEDEIALGRRAARELKVHRGDDITLAGPTGQQRYRVTGLVVVQGLGANEGVGEGGVVTLPGLGRVDATAQVTSAVVTFRPGSDGIEAYRDLLPPGAVPEDKYVPAPITSVQRVRGVPFVLAGVLAVLAAITVGQCLLGSVRARRRDLAVLSSLGADRSFVSRAVHWQASAFAIAPMVLAVPAGFVVGRAIFSAYADGIGAVHDAVFPALALLAAVAGLLLLANLVVVLPWSRRRQRPSAILRAE